MDSIRGIQAGNVGGDRQAQFRTYDTFAGIRDRLDHVDMKKAKDLIPYVLNNKLVIPDNPAYGCIPPGAKMLPVSNGALKNIVNNALYAGGDEGQPYDLEDREMIFYKPGSFGTKPPEIAVGALGLKWNYIVNLSDLPPYTPGRRDAS